jgi:hypothetical protein
MKEKISNIATANTKFTHDIICSHVELTNSFIDCFTITHIPTKMLDRIAYISYIAIQSKVIIDKNIVLTSHRHLAFWWNKLDSIFLFKIYTDGQHFTNCMTRWRHETPIVIITNTTHIHISDRAAYISQSSTSIYIQNNKGDNMPACLTPFVTSNSSLQTPFHFTLKKGTYYTISE